MEMQFTHGDRHTERRWADDIFKSIFLMDIVAFWSKFHSNVSPEVQYASIGAD